jgi:hypothetical protein
VVTLTPARPRRTQARLALKPCWCYSNLQSGRPAQSFQAGWERVQQQFRIKLILIGLDWRPGQASPRGFAPQALRSDYIKTGG